MGFMGSNFVRYMLKKYPKIQIINLDKLTYAGNPENLKDIKTKRYQFVKGDICNQKLVKRVVKQVDAIINYAAETHVDRSILKPDAFIKTDVLGTYTLLEAGREFKIKKYIQISCYDTKTRALTTDGLKTYKEIKKGDKVFSLNPKTFEIEIKPVEKIIVQSHRGKMIEFKNQRVNLLVTPNHNMFIINTVKKKLLIERADKVSKRCIFYLPQGRWKGKNEKDIKVKNYGKVKTKDLLYVLGVFIGDGFTAYQEKITEAKTGLTKKEYLKNSRDKKGRFSTMEKQGNHKIICHSYRIFFDIPEKDKCRKRVEKVLRNMRVKYSHHRGVAGTHLYFTSKAFMELFDQCGKGAKNKRIPRWALKYSQQYLKYLFQGLMDSDGYKNKVYYTVSKKLTSDFCELCLKLNLKPSIYKTKSKSFIEKRKIEGKSFYIFVAKTQKSISRHRIKAINYSGDVWCLKVKDNKNFLVERNGKFDFCGNTDEVYGSIKQGSSDENYPFEPNSPYSASKAGADHLVRVYNITYGVPTIRTNACNNYGPYQYPEKLIPLFITNLIEKKKVPVYGQGEQIREWIYVLDHCKAIDLILKKGKPGEAYNIGTGERKKNIEVTKILLRNLKLDQKMIEYVKDRPGHDLRYALDSSKIKRELGFKPEYKFKEGIKKTIEWYKNNQKWWEKIKSGEFKNYYLKQYQKR